ncbi:hypothetical protein DL95DRAFT_394756 [Leptodontidium sp. 2 PMI_412]|nr:hypothetical protein DL95DRAFT_394756 [Leptodontidium sp. 2 PMI_412]
MIPATPEAPSKCPMPDFTAPTYRGLSETLPFHAAPMAPASIGSPSAVPVPWAST